LFFQLVFPTLFPNSFSHHNSLFFCSCRRYSPTTSQSTYLARCARCSSRRSQVNQNKLTHHPHTVCVRERGEPIHVSHSSAFHLPNDSSSTLCSCMPHSYCIVALRPVTVPRACVYGRACTCLRHARPRCGACSSANQKPWGGKKKDVETLVGEEIVEFVLSAIALSRGGMLEQELMELGASRAALLRRSRACVRACGACVHVCVWSVRVERACVHARVCACVRACGACGVCLHAVSFSCPSRLLSPFRKGI
jgi:hypothetical protein